MAYCTGPGAKQWKGHDHIHRPSKEKAEGPGRQADPVFGECWPERMVDLLHRPSNGKATITRPKARGFALLLLLLSCSLAHVYNWWRAVRL